MQRPTKTIPALLMLLFCSLSVIGQGSPTNSIPPAAPSPGATGRPVTRRFQGGPVSTNAATPPTFNPAAQPATIPPPANVSPAVVLPGVVNPALPAVGPQPVGALPNPAPATPGATTIPTLEPGATRTEAEKMIDSGTIQLQGAQLDQVFEIYGILSGRTVLRAYQMQGPQAITLKLQSDMTRAEAIEAMDGVLALNGISMIPLGEKFVKAVPYTTAMQEGAQISQLNAKEMPDSEQFITRIVKLKTAKPSEIAPLFASFSKSPTAITPIDSNQTIILRDNASNVKRMLEIIERVDVIPQNDFKLEVIPIKYGKVGDIYETMNALISGTGAAPLGAGTPRTTGVGPAGRNRGYGGAGAGGYGQQQRGYGGGGYGGYGGAGYGGGIYPQEASVTPMQAAVRGAQPGVAAGQSSFQNRLNQIVSKAAGDEVKILENAHIVPDERSNKLLIFANKRDMEMITNIVSKVDVLLAQVLIEAIILEVKLHDSMNVGVSMVQNPRQFGNNFTGGGGVNNGQPFNLSSVTNFASSLPSGFSYFGSVGRDLDIALNAIAQDSQINILSRPRIQTSHAVPGNFVIAETVPYITGIASYGGIIGTGLGTQSTVIQQPIGLELNVTPFITPDGLVVMDISQNFDQRGADVIIDGNPIPVVNTRSASATLTVRDKDTIMLGGFITENKSRSKSGVPFLKDIPGIGALFRSKNDSSDRTELIVLMRATVLETPEAAAIMASSERRELPGIMQAEKEFQDNDAKRMKKAKRAVGKN